jgi:hypothetical protein
MVALLLVVACTSGPGGDSGEAVCVAGDELCDGVDNDCDGVVDEDPSDPAT